jgi:hypothetical protein
LTRWSRSEPRRQVLIFEIRIVDCRARSIRIGVIGSAACALARMNEPPTLLGARRPVKVARTDGQARRKPRGVFTSKASPARSLESGRIVAWRHGGGELNGSACRGKQRSPSVKRRIPESGIPGTGRTGEGIDLSRAELGGGGMLAQRSVRSTVKSPGSCGVSYRRPRVAPTRSGARVQREAVALDGRCPSGARGRLVRPRRRDGGSKARVGTRGENSRP